MGGDIMKVTGTVVKVIWHKYYGSGNNYIFEFLPDGYEKTINIAGTFGRVNKGERMTLQVEQSNKDNLYNVVHGGFIIEYNMYSLYKVITTVKGIGTKKATEIINTVQKSRVARNAPLTVSSLDEFIPDVYELNISTKQKEDIIKTIYEFQIVDELYYILGSSLELKDAINMSDYILLHDLQKQISEDPYKLVDVNPTLNIRQLDNYVMREFNIDKTNLNRVAAYIKSTMYYYINTLKLDIVNRDQIIKKCTRSAQVPSFIVGQAIDNMCSLNELIKFEDNTYMISRYYEIEKEIATRLAKLLTLAIDEFIPSEVEYHIMNTYANAGYYSDEQIAAIKAAFNNRVSIITGGAGTGKSTVIQAIYELAQSLDLNPIAIAPTGKAADRLSNLGGKTIHYSIGWNGLQAQRQLYNQFYIIDEASMVDLDILAEFLKSIPEKSFIVFVGDPFQLPAVGAGAPFQVLIESKLIHVTTLNKVFRQSEGKLLRLAYAVNNRNYGEVIRLLSQNDKEVAKITIKSEELVDVIKHIIDKRGNNATILIPTRHKRASIISTETINSIGLKIVTKKFRSDPKMPQVTKCICVENDYSRGIFNGQIGYIQHNTSNDYITHIAFGERVYEYTPIEYSRYIEPAYALTVHKSQGSEFNDTVFISFIADHAYMWTKQLLYTAITRAKKSVCFITDVNFERTLQSTLISNDLKPVSFIPYYLELLLKKEVDDIVAYIQDA